MTAWLAVASALAVVLAVLPPAAPLPGPCRPRAEVDREVADYRAESAASDAVDEADRRKELAVGMPDVGAPIPILCGGWLSSGN